MIEIIPAILTDNPEEAHELISAAEGVVKRIQIDIIDGKFADNRTIDPAVLNNSEFSGQIDFHLMVKEPINWIKKCVKAGGDRIIGQIEMMSDQAEFVEEVIANGASPGLAVDLDTELSQIDPGMLKEVDVVLIMSVPAGFGGQEFDERSLDKVKKLDQIRNESEEINFRICDDGGITLDTVDDEARAGADEVSIGRRIFKGDLSENIEKFMKASNG